MNYLLIHIEISKGSNVLQFSDNIYNIDDSYNKNNYYILIWNIMSKLLKFLLEKLSERFFIIES